MTRFRALTITAVLIALVAGGAAFAQGQGPGRRGPGGIGGRGGFGGPGGGLPVRELNLSDTQQQQMRDVAQQYREQSRAAAEQLRTAMEAQRKAVQTLPVNEGLIRSTTQALAEAQTEAAIQQARMQSEIFALLTPAQQEQARKLQAERETRLQQQRQRTEQRRPQPPRQ
jgi:periplasmic protein CpxP/Spy